MRTSQASNLPPLAPSDLPALDPLTSRTIAAASPQVAQAFQGWAAEELGRTKLYHLRRKLAKSANTLEYIDLLIEAGVPADVGRMLTFEGREFWREIYLALWSPCFAVQSSAQVGKTIMLFHGAHALPHLFGYQGRGIWHGIYMPTREMVGTFSKGRLGPILEAVGEQTGVSCGGFVPDELAAAEKRSSARPGKRPTDSYNFKKIAKSYLYLAWVKGTLVDALPLDVAWIDEVRLIEDPGRVDRIEKRVMGSELGWLGFTSTAGMPGDAMSVRFDQSDQRRWHHPCGCAGGVDLAMIWPNCLGERPGAATAKDRFYLYCPRCGQEVRQRNAGRWVQKNDGGMYPGFSPNQLMTRQPLVKIAMAWRRADRNTQEFYNSVLGLPFLDKESCPMNMDVLKACVNEDVLWARAGDTTRACMGIDQMGGVNYYVIATRTPAGKRRISHLEIGFDADPFKRAAELMRDYDVSVCVLEPLPNYNDALRFANAFRGRVFVVHYTKNMPDGQIRWGDRDEESDGERIVAQAQKTRYHVKVQQQKIMDALAVHWRERLPEVPNPRELRQGVPHEHGGDFIVETCWEVYFDHLQRIARRQVTEKKIADGIDVPELTGNIKYHWVKLARRPDGARPAPVKGAASDPHFAFADLMCWLAWTRLDVAGWKPTVLYI